MFNRDWNHGLAFGLIVGIAAAVFFFLLVQSGHGDLAQATDAVNGGTNSQDQCDYGDEPIWGPWFGLCFGLSDTIAQWLMMAFTVIAAGLLYGTLRQSNRANFAAAKAAEAATEANRIMRNEQRPWVQFDLEAQQVVFSRSDGSEDLLQLTAKLTIRNHGAMPAANMWICCCAFQSAEVFPVGQIMEAAKTNPLELRPTNIAGNTVFNGDAIVLESDIGCEIVKVVSDTDPDKKPKSRFDFLVWAAYGYGIEDDSPFFTFCFADIKVGPLIAQHSGPGYGVTTNHCDVRISRQIYE